MKKRIWELDAARGLALLGMLVIHFLYDLVDLWQVFSWQEPGWYCFIKNNCGFIFLVISGISVTLGSNCLRRGAQVFACGMLCTAVTAGMYLLGLADRGILIYFGVLHCLGVCMLLWHWLRRLPGWSVALLGLVLILAGLILGRLYLDVSWVWLPLGLCPWWLSSSDYFPLLPNLGFFLLGVEYAPVWALAVAAVDALPILGTGTILVPWSLVCLLQKEGGRALGLLGLYAATALSRSFLEPKLVGRQLGLDPLVTLIALYTGFRLWGLLGMFLMPMLAITVISMLPESRKEQ